MRLGVERTGSRLYLGALALLAVVFSGQAEGEFPPSLWLKFEEVASGPAEMTDVQNAGDGSRRLFLVEQQGRIRILQNGQVLAEPFLDISDRGWFRGEDGLLGLAFPPGYANKGYFYIYYRLDTDLNPDQPIRLSRFQVGADPNRADPNSEEILLEAEGGGGNHFGGQLAFGPNDGHLYVAVGDREQSNWAQDLAIVPGKILRLDTESPIPPGHVGPPYLIPASNPHVGQAGVREEILFHGLRNAWRFSFDPGSGDLYIGDVGGRSREEINVVSAAEINAGANFGWPFREGTVEWSDPGAVGPLTAPVFEYARDQGTCVIGGHFYHGPDPRLEGLYVFGDWGSGKYWAMKRDGDQWLQQFLQMDSLRPACFGCDEDGELYMIRDRMLYRVTAPNYAGTPLIESRVAPWVDSAQVTMTTPTRDSEIRYTLDGSDPTANSPLYDPAESLRFTVPALVRARAFNANLSQSPIAEERVELKAPIAVIDPPGGTVHNPFRATLSTEAIDGEIRYTLDGTDPDESSPLYTDEPISIASTVEFRATVFKDGWLPSFTSSASYRLVAHSPRSHNHQPELYEPIDLVSLTEGATFHYTLDGSRPNTGSPIWSTPLLLPAGTVLQAIAVRPPLETSSPSWWRVERMSAARARIFPVAGGGSLANLNEMIDPFDGRLVNGEGIAVDQDGELWISSRQFGTQRLWRLANGKLVLILERTNGVWYEGLDIGQGTDLWMVDTGSYRTVRFTSPRSSTDSVLYGQGTIQRPRDLTVRTSGKILVADSLSYKIWALDPEAGPVGTITTFAGTGKLGSGDGPALAATFQVPRCVTDDGRGTVYVADGGSHASGSRIRKIDASGMVSTLAGSTAQSSLDGPIASAEFDSIESLAADAIGNLYVAQTGWGIRKISPDGWVSTFQGTRFANDGVAVDGTNHRPLATALDVDPAGVIYFVDWSGAYRLVQDDWDNDYIPDIVEIETPACVVGVDDRGVDADGDEHSNATEVAAGTDPQNGAESPRASGVSQREDGGFWIWFPTEAGKRYQLEFSDSGIDWMEMGLVVTASHASTLFSDRIDPELQCQRFYRLRELP